MPNEQFNYDNPQHKVPAAALRLDATAELGDRSSDDTKTAPIRLRARSGDPIDHWYFGRVVHDLDGFELTGDKSRLALLYEHSEPIGYALAKNISVDSGDMEVSGTLVETRNSNRATDVIDWMAAGIPFEASISFAGDAPVMELLKTDQDETEVNGKTFSGPGVVIRKWKLREVSVVTSGADDDTESALFNQSDSVSVKFIQSERAEDMSKEELTATEAVVDEKVDEAVDESGIDNAEVEAETVETVDAQPEVEPVEMSATPDGKTFMDVFGRVEGAVYFAEGLSMDEALQREVKRLREENVELRQKLESDDAGAGFSQGGEMKSNVLTAIPGEVCDQVLRTN